MKLISVEQTSLLWLGAATREEGQFYLPELVGALEKEFKFLEVPDVSSDISNLVFKHGKFKDFAVAQMSMHSDGLILRAQAPSSKLDELFNHLRKWAKKNFNVELVQTALSSPVYESHIVVQSDAPIAAFFKKFAKLGASLDTKILAASRIHAKSSLSGFTIDTNSPSEPIRPIPFKFERRIGTSPELGFYFSSAPIPTSDHLDLLQELEAAIKS